MLDKIYLKFYVKKWLASAVWHRKIMSVFLFVHVFLLSCFKAIEGIQQHKSWKQIKTEYCIQNGTIFCNFFETNDRKKLHTFTTEFQLNVLFTWTFYFTCCFVIAQWFPCIKITVADLAYVLCFHFKLYLSIWAWYLSCSVWFKTYKRVLHIPWNRSCDFFKWG